MADPKDIDSAITLELSGDTTTSDDFRVIVTAFDGLLKAVTKSARGDTDDLRWAIRTKEGSILLAFDPIGDTDVETVKEVFSHTLNAQAVSSEYGEAVRHIHTLSRKVGVHLWVGQERTSITGELYSSLEASLRKPYRLHGTVEGRLTTLSERSVLAIYEPVWERRIECSVPDEQLEGMRDLWRKRVTAHGMVHYGIDGYPTRIDAEKIDPFPDDEELPSHMDVLGILRAD